MMIASSGIVLRGIGDLPSRLPPEAISFTAYRGSIHQLTTTKKPFYSKRVRTAMHGRALSKAATYRLGFSSHFVLALLSMTGTPAAAQETVTGTSTAQFNLQTTSGSGYVVVIGPGDPTEVEFNATNAVAASAVVDGGFGPFTLTNNGSIRSTGSVGVLLSSIGGGTVINRNMITGSAQGILISSGFGSVTNAAYAKITGNTVGIQFNQGGQVLNQATAAIFGTAAGGVTINGGSNVTNNVINGGSITGATTGVIIANGGNVANGSVDGGGTLTPGAVIKGNGNAVQLGTATGSAGGTVTNYAGTIESTGAAGVYIVVGVGTVNNADSIIGKTQGVIITPIGTVNNVGVITGGTRGVQLSGGGTIYNGSLDHGVTVIANALIAGGTSDGVQLGATGTVNNYAGSAIASTAAGAAGVLVSAGIGTINNAGMISGVDQGVRINTTGAVTNSGTIKGTNTDTNLGNGIYFSIQGGSVTNIGTISGSGNNGIFFNSPAGVIVDNAGTIIGLNNGIQLGTGGAPVAGDGKINNTGTITGATNNGIAVLAGSANVSNANGAIISGSKNGVQFGVTASGTSSVWNDGLIGATMSSGVFMQNGGSVTNGVTGEIKNLAVTLGGDQNGVTISGGIGSVTNNGLISSTIANGVQINAGGNVDNSGNIQGQASGIFLQGGGAITNAAGSITGNSGNGILAGGGVTVNNSALIRGATNAVQFLSGDNVLWLKDHSTTTGIVRMGSGADAATIYEGADISGVTEFNNGSGTSSLIFDGYNGAVRNITAVAGSEWQSVTVKNGAILDFDGVDTHAGMQFNIDDGAIVVGGLADTTTLDTRSVVLGALGGLVFNHDNTDSYFFAPVISGSGTVSQKSGTTALTADNSDFSGLFMIAAGATLSISKEDNLGTADITSDGELKVTSTTDFILANKLTGAGLVTVDTGGETLDFIATAGSTFTGTVALGNSTFALQNDNTIALTYATLRADAGSITTVGDGDQQIGQLNINGGTLVFNAMVPDKAVATSTITANSLDASHAGTVQIILSATYMAPAPDADGAVNLLRQDEGNILTRLVNATSVTGSGSAISLVDQDSDAIASARQLDISQGGEVVAKGTYDFRLTTAPGDGLYVNYGLTQLDLQLDQTLELAPDTDATGAAADMSAKITGTGNLSIAVGAGTVSLSNTANDYSGETTAASGTLRLDADSALGNTGMLHIADAATTDVNGKTQTIGQLDGQAGSVLDVNGGRITITGGGTSAGSLTGAGQLNVAGGLLNVHGANADLTASTAIVGGATAQLDDVQGLGSGTIADSGTLALAGASGALVNAISGTGAVDLTNAADVTASGDNSDFSGTFATATGTALTVAEQMNLGTASVAGDGKLVVDTATDWTLSNAVSGIGGLVKRGTGTLTAGDALTYIGTTAINAGTLVVGNTVKPNITLGGTGVAQVSVANGATLAGLGTVKGQVVNTGTVSALNALPGYAAGAAGTFTLANGLVNGGTINLAGTSVGNQLVVRNGYTGDNGTLILNTVLGDDNSVTDKLVIDGGTASGHTSIRVINTGGLGAATTGNGITVVSAINGATTSKDAFTLNGGHVDAGAYEYYLFAGASDGTGESWYLRNTSPTPTPTPTPAYRTEAALLAALPRALRQDLPTYHERMGDRTYKPEVGLTVPGRIWGRMIDEDTHIRQGGELAPESKGNSFGFQIGVNLLQIMTSSGVQHDVGVYAGHTDTSLTVHGFASGIEDKLAGTLKPDTTFAGAYWTMTTPQGFYADAVFQRSWFAGRANASNGNVLPIDGGGMLGSVELGYNFAVSDRWSLEPQVQGIIQGLSIDDVQIPSALVKQDPGSSVTGRLGVRLKGDYEISSGRIQPYLRANLWRELATVDRITFVTPAATTRLATPGSALWGEGGAGLTWSLTPNVALYGEADYRFDLDGSLGRTDQAASGSIGLKVNF